MSIEDELRHLQAQAAALSSRIDRAAAMAEVRLGELILAQGRKDDEAADAQQSAAQLHIEERERLAGELATVRGRIRELEAESRPSRKNVYIPADAREVWEHAERLAGESLSSLLTDLLRGFVKDKQAAEEGWERIVVTVDNNPPSKPPRKAFWGRWVISPDVPFPNSRFNLALAETRGGHIAIYAFGDSTIDDELVVFTSVDQANEECEWDLPREFLELAADRLGREEVEELDI
jgi:hypothetical protein